MRIVYCVDNIHNLGGIEHVTTVKANALADIEGNDVWIVSFEKDRGEGLFAISEKVHVVYLSISNDEDAHRMNKLQLLYHIVKKKKEHKEALQAALKAINPDIVISTGFAERKVLPLIPRRYRGVIIREQHFAKNWFQLLQTNLYGKIVSWLNDFIDYNFFIKKYDRVVTLTNEDKTRSWKNNPKVIVISNPNTKPHGQRSTLTSQKVITVGRLTRQKNHKSLIRSWRKVHQKHPDWTLEIWGDGEEKNQLQQQIEELNLRECVFLKGATNDVMSKMAETSVFVLSSLYEGLPLVVLEAMSCGLPVVSYACPCGPKDIITEGKDGYLVPPGDEESLAERICFLIEHEDIRREMGKEAAEKSKQYAIEPIIRQWMTLFSKLTAKKQ